MRPGELPQTLYALGLMRIEMGRWDAAEEAALLLADIAEARGLDLPDPCGRRVAGPGRRACAATRTGR